MEMMIVWSTDVTVVGRDNCRQFPFRAPKRDIRPALTQTMTSSGHENVEDDLQALLVRL